MRARLIGTVFPLALFLVGASGGCGKVSTTAEDEDEDGDGDEDEDEDEDEDDWCYRGPIDSSSCVAEFGSVYALDGGFEFIDLSGWLLAQGSDAFRLFEIALCRVNELSLPEELSGRAITLARTWESTDNALLACNDITCEAWAEVPPRPKENDDGSPSCPFAGLERRAVFGSPALTHVTYYSPRREVDWKEPVETVCAWNEFEAHCNINGVLAPVLYPEESIDTVHRGDDGCIVINYFSGGYGWCFDGSSWEGPERWVIPPTILNEFDCEGSRFIGSSMGVDIGVTDDGVLLRQDRETKECSAQTEPLGTVVSTGSLSCGCSLNPVVVTTTEVFTSFACMSCR
jgi:hypothetical protein